MSYGAGFSLSNARRLNESIETSGTIRLIQITDCHLGENVGEQLVGMDTDQSLDLVIDLVSAELAKTPSKNSLLVATGDLANHGSAPAYARLQQKLAKLEMPKAWLPGNHDSVELMQSHCDPAEMPRLICAGNWYIYLLDSTVPGKVGGNLGAEQIQSLMASFAELPSEANILLCLHHQPVSIGCDWLDKQMIADSDAFIEAVASESRLRAIIWGHVHQAFSGRDERLPTVQLMSAPSTCVQFAPNSAEFQLDAKSPGYRRIELHPDGQLQVSVERVDGSALKVDLDSRGY
jgi:Icc protein